MTELSEDRVLTILTEMHKQLNNDEQAARLLDARQKCNNNMMKSMCLIYPIVVENQLKVLELFGYSSNRHNLLTFIQTGKVMARSNAEISQLQSQIEAIYLPPIIVPNKVNN